MALDPGVLASVTPGLAVTSTFAHETFNSSLSVSASVEEVGVKADGGMANPSGFSTVGWYKYGSQPGAEGRAVIAGHVNNALGLSGVFARLSDIAIGERFVVSDKEGSTLTYSVREKTQYARKDAPFKDIFTTTGPFGACPHNLRGGLDTLFALLRQALVVVAELMK